MGSNPGEVIGGGKGEIGDAHERSGMDVNSHGCISLFIICDKFGFLNSKLIPSVFRRDVLRNIVDYPVVYDMKSGQMCGLKKGRVIT